MKSRISHAEAVLWIASVAATVTLTTHVMQWRNYASETENVATASPKPVAQATVRNTDMTLGAPYRDGLFVGKLAQQRGENREPSVGRWATQTDREAFSAGYDQGNVQTADATNRN
jgi:hypothetical protein